jgi:hypothetical protein
MLHPVPDSAERARLLDVVEMQRELMEALCGLPQGSAVGRSWLEGLWPTVPAEWIGRFWENEKGNRAKWLNAIAAATPADKQTICALVAEQLRFSELYHSPPTVRLTEHDWKPPVFDAVNKLLKSFYDPLFYKKQGFHNLAGESFHKDHFISAFNPRVWICPYTDNVIQDTKLDHFLPKDRFPMLSCHPDNLIPCSTDANSGSHKGTESPLDPEEADQAGAWFHPRWRPCAKEKYRLTFSDGPAPQPRVQFVAIAAQDQPRLDNMARMFGLSEFWGSFLDDEVQSVAGDVQGWLEVDGLPPTEENVRARVLHRARQERKRIGRDGLAIVKSYFYEHIAHTPLLLAQIVRTCLQAATR